MADKFEAEKEMTRSETAEYLRTFADELEKGGRVVIVSGGDCEIVNPPNAVLFRVDTSEDRSWLGGDGGGRSVSLEMGWNADEVTEEHDLNIVPEPGRETVSDRMREIQGDEHEAERLHEDRHETAERREAERREEGTTRREH